MRTIVFVDYQNVYRRARAAFFPASSPSGRGAVDPLALGRLLASRSASGGRLSQVRVYRGLPDPARDPTGYGAVTKQAAAHTARGGGIVHNLLRPLQYSPKWPREPAREKGIDVALAVDFVAMALEGSFDVGVIASTDTDLRPALEAVTSRGRTPRCEVAAWGGPHAHTRRLSIRGVQLWCHWLSRADYDAVADTTDYVRGGPRRPPEGG